jgi:hypothetical protein
MTAVIVYGHPFDAGPPCIVLFSILRLPPEGLLFFPSGGVFCRIHLVPNESNSISGSDALS